MEEEGRRRNVFGVSGKPSDSFYTMHATVGCDQPVAGRQFSFGHLLPPDGRLGAT